jgi:hypothetical protein
MPKPDHIESITRVADPPEGDAQYRVTVRGEHSGLGTDLAPEGMVWQCMACGKRARSRYGFDAQDNDTKIDYGYDESCMMHAELVRKEGASE